MVQMFDVHCSNNMYVCFVCLCSGYVPQRFQQSGVLQLHTDVHCAAAGEGEGWQEEVNQDCAPFLIY